MKPEAEMSRHDMQWKWACMRVEAPAKHDRVNLLPLKSFVAHPALVLVSLAMNQSMSIQVFYSTERFIAD